MFWINIVTHYFFLFHMTMHKNGSVLPFLAGFLLAGLLTGGVSYYLYMGATNDLKENIKIPVTQKCESPSVDDSCILTLNDGVAVETEQAYDGDSGMKMYDFVIFNHTLTEILPRICAYQSTQEVENALCIVMEISEKGGDPVGALKEYRDTL